MDTQLSTAEPRPKQSAAIAAGLVYARLHMRVLPLAAGQKVPCIKDWSRKASDDPGVVAQWVADFSAANIGWAMGGGLVGLDFDTKTGGMETLARIEAKRGALPRTVEARTPSGGRHFVYRTGLPVPNAVGVLPGLDLRGAGGQLVVAPSRTAAGLYRWVNPPWTTAVAPAPAWFPALLSMARPRSKRISDDQWVELLSSLAEGRRNEGLTRIAGHLFSVTTSGLAGQLVRVINAQCCRPCLDDGEVETIIRSIGARDAARYAVEQS